MSRRLYLCEGKWDVCLLRNAIEDFEPGVEIEEFFLEEINGQRRGEETRKIDWLKKPVYPGDVLIKSEGGRTFLKRTLAESVNDLISEQIEVNILADLDHRDLNEWISDVNERINYTREIRLKSLEETYDCPILCGHTCEVIVNSQTVEQFGLVAFKQKMEEAVGIDKGSHDSGDRLRLINQFLSSSDDFEIAFNRTF